MNTIKKLPFGEIREMGLEELADKLRILDGFPKETRETIKREATDILNTKEYCQMLGIKWTNLENGRRADYAAMLIVTQGYSFY